MGHEFKPRSGHIKDYEISIWSLSANHATLWSKLEQKLVYSESG